ncbi:NB-ARC domain-containing protein [Halomonas sp. ATCH28]|uniref:NB-ARC domain-containing protein n=1 Tax=Halomonas gemina TaxID=2945105 RepID=A0ABT0SZE9_9GAMM|nr:NB-ARC domain-containing protein [Halomonas gemina]MCL7939987.1 NB-ARC domain-containing protein [Halomonas gemina]
MSSSPNVPSDRPGLFISYARDDDEAFAKRLWLDLEKHGFRVWWDREAMESRGRSFLREIRDAIAAAERVLLIVGPRVRHSPYIEVEWRHALREGVVVTPLLRLGDYEEVPEALRPLHCEDVRSSIPEMEALEKVRRIISTPVPALAPLVGVPRLPTPYLERPDRLDHLRSRVLIDSYRPIDLQPDQRITSLTGMGGVGKSVLAAALAQAPDVRRSFADGIYWIAVGRDASTLRTLTRVGLAVNDDAVDRYSGVAEARLLLGKTLAKKNCLLVLDDVWEVEVAEALHTAAGKNVRILLTGRKRQLFASAGVHEIPVDELSKGEALNLLADWTEASCDKLPPEAAEIAKECGNLPLALAMIGATIRGRPDRWGHALERLRRADLSKIQRKLPDYAYETLDRAMLVSFEDLDQDRQQRYLDLVAVPEDTAAPAAMLRAWWAHEGMDELDAIQVLDDLVDRSLLRMDERQAYTLHDVQRDFLVMRTADMSALHARWLAAFAPPTPDGWAAVEDDGYLFDHLGHHLRGAGREDEWRELLVSFGWLERKTRVCGFPAILLDLAAYSTDSGIGPLYRSCRRAAHILTNDPAQLAAQLLARIDASPALEPLLEGARAWRGGPWLRPVTPSLGEEGEPMLAVFRGREEDGHAGTPRSIALSADGSLIASGGGSSNDLTVKVWSVSAAMLLRTFAGAVEAGGATSLAFVAPDGRLAGASRSEVRLYALDADEPVALRKFDGAYVSCICGDGHAGIVFVGFDDGRVLAWDPATNTTVELREPEGDRVIALAHASYSPRLAIATASVIECRDAQDGQPVGRLEEGMGNSELHFQAPPLVLTPNGSRMFFGNPARAWTVSEPEAAPLLETTNAERVVGLTDDGAVALTAPDDHELVAIEVATGRRIGRIWNSREFSCLALACDSRMVATGDYEHDVKLWNFTHAETEPPGWERRDPVRSVAVCDNPSLAFVATDDRHELWDTATSAPLDEQGQLASDRVERRSKPLLDPRIEQKVRAQLEEAFSVIDGTETDRFFRHSRPLLGLWKKLRARLEKALGATRDDMTYTVIHQTEIPVGVLAFSQTASRAVSAPRYLAKFTDMEETTSDSADVGGDYPLHLWDLEKIREPRFLRGHRMPITCADMTVDGTRALTGSWGRLLRLWDLDAGVCLKILRGHRGIVFDCSLTEDAQLAVSGSEDMTVRLWELAQGKLLFTFATSSAVISCDIARDGSVAIAAEVSGRVHTFSVDGLTRP